MAKSRVALLLTGSLVVCLATAHPRTARHDSAQQQEASPAAWQRGDFGKIEGLSVRRVEFVGNERTSDAPVRRRLGVNEGDVFSLGQLRRGLKRVNQLGCFYTTTEKDVEWLADKEERVVDFTIHFRERPRRPSRCRVGS